MLANHLGRFKKYPPLAQRNGIEGKGMLRFTIDRQGNVLEAHIETSTGNSVLDREILAMLRRAEPLPPFSAELTQRSMELTVPVDFSLR